MYLSKISFLPEKMNLKSNEISYKNDDYGIHQWIWELFSYSKDQKRNFLYRREESESFPLFYALSDKPPKNSFEEWNIQTKEYSPKLNSGDILEFSLRVNPVICHKVNDKPRRDDIVMNLKWNKYKNFPIEQRPSQSEIEREAGIVWLKNQSKERGFEFNESQIFVDSYNQHVFYKKQKKIKISSLDFKGLLKVTETKIFINEVLFHGLGHAKAFGCGLMLVKKV